MHVESLACFECGKTYPKTQLRYYCECNGSLNIIYKYEEIKNNISWAKLRKRKFNHWRYREFFPIIKDKYITTLGEGGSPMVHSGKIGTCGNVYFKCEGVSQTGSFKDRGTTVELSKALEFGATEIVAASTGNMGASISAYAAAAGIKATIYVPIGSPHEKLEQMHSYGAHVVHVKHGGYVQAARYAYRDFKKKGIYLLGDYAYRGEGEKSVGYEIMDEMNKVDYIISPIGNGTLLGGIWKGLTELKMVGMIKKMPKMVGVQAAGCNTVVRAFNNNDEIKSVTPKTIAGAISVGDPSDGDKALAALKESNGLATTVTDKEILTARREMARNEGIDCEPCGAVAWAGIKKLKLPQNAVKVAIVTGHGLKDLENM
jgi:threonine synthase